MKNCFGILEAFTSIPTSYSYLGHKCAKMYIFGKPRTMCDLLIIRLGPSFFTELYTLTYINLHITIMKAVLSLILFIEVCLYITG